MSWPEIVLFTFIFLVITDYAAAKYSVGRLNGITDKARWDCAEYRITIEKKDEEIREAKARAEHYKSRCKLLRYQKAEGAE